MGEQQIFTLGVWKTKPGKEAEFIELWQSFADWTAVHMAGAGSGTLLQDAENPRQFISYGPWRDSEAVRNWRDTPEFKDFAARARGLCDEFEPQNMLRVGHTD